MTYNGANKISVLPSQLSVTSLRFDMTIALTRFNKIAIQGTPQMAEDKEAIRLPRVYSYDFKCT